MESTMLCDWMKAACSIAMDALDFTIMIKLTTIAFVSEEIENILILLVKIIIIQCLRLFHT